jgi:hypothetical protein
LYISFFFAGRTCIYLAISLLTNGACFGKSNLLEAYINFKKAKNGLFFCLVSLESQCFMW